MNIDALIYMHYMQNMTSYFLTLLCSSFPPTQATIALEMDERMITESGVAIATASAVIIQGLVNLLGLFIALALASITALCASLR